MKSIWKKTAILFMSVVIIASSIVGMGLGAELDKVNVYAQDDIITGECGMPGSDVHYTINKTTKVCTVSGTGEILKLNVSQSGIEKIVIEEGITGWSEIDIFGWVKVLSLPSTLKRVGRISGNNLESFIVDPNNEVYESKDNCVIKKENNELVLGCKTSVIPSSVERIANYAFNSCGGLESIYIPSDVKSMGTHAFDECRNLSSITVASDNPVFDSRDNCNAIIKKENNELIQGSASTVIPSSVAKIGNYAFYMINLKNITIPGSVESIGTRAFYECGDLSSVTILNGVTSIGEFAFKFNQSLRNISIPESITNIEMGAFSECIELDNITIPKGITSIKSRTFSGCNSLSSVMIPDSVTNIEDYAFMGCSSLSSVIIPDSVNYIENGAFMGCSSLSGVTIPESVYNIKYHALGYKNALTKIENFTITGVKGTSAERYATENGFKFIGREPEKKLTIEEQAKIDNVDKKFLTEEDGNQYWYENGIKQGVKKNADGSIDNAYRGKEIYDEATDGWYWLDNIDGGKKAVSKDVYQDSFAGNWGDIINVDGSRNGKWVRYDAQGKMVKGWCLGAGADAKVIEKAASATDGQPVYYFDKIYGTMAKGYATVDGVEYYFNPVTGVLERTVTEGLAGFTGWKEVDGVSFWYEDGNRQGTSANTSYRGKEIYDPGTNAWYWLDNIDGGKKAVSKDVYQESLAGDWGDIVKEDGQKYGKWVRYDAEGHMIKGWCQGRDDNAMSIDGVTSASDGQPVYYFDPIYGTMAKGNATIDGVDHYFNPATGVMEW